MHKYVQALQVLDERDFPYKDIKMLSSARSAGKTYDFQGKTYTVEELKEDSFGDCDIALFSAGGGISKKFGPIASEAGCTVVDNSSAFRMTEGVPLVIPEVNADAMKGMKVRNILTVAAGFVVRLCSVWLNECYLVLQFNISAVSGCVDLPEMSAAATCTCIIFDVLYRLGEEASWQTPTAPRSLHSWR